MNSTLLFIFIEQTEK